MEQKYMIISDGSCDLNDDLIKEAPLEVVPFYVSFDNVNYYKEKEEFSVHDFYQQMVDNPNVYPKTSMPTSEDYYNVFVKYAKRGMNIICICITQKFSGSFQAASIAKEQIESEYQVKVEVIDSLINTCIQGVLVLEALRMQKDGLSFSECVEKIYSIRGTGRIFFTVDTMEYLRHGGRIGKLLGLIGATLKIKPLIVLKEGEIFPLGLTFTKNQSVVKVVDNLKKHLTLENRPLSDYRFIVGSGYDPNDALWLKELILKKIGNVEIMVGQIGATIGVHTGPNPIGIGIINKYDA